MTPVGEGLKNSISEATTEQLFKVFDGQNGEKGDGKITEAEFIAVLGGENGQIDTQDEIDDLEAVKNQFGKLATENGFDSGAAQAATTASTLLETIESNKKVSEQISNFEHTEEPPTESTKPKIPISLDKPPKSILTSLIKEDYSNIQFSLTEDTNLTSSTEIGLQTIDELTKLPEPSSSSNKQTLTVREIVDAALEPTPK